jgi:hypothetical protein
MAWFLRVIMIALLWSVPLAAMGQSAQPAIAPTQPLLKSAELDQLLAPLALYPDPLLSEVLIASTCPGVGVVLSSYTQATISVQATASTTGPTNSPASPYAIKPPMTPIRITGIGVIRPRAITIGLKMLSTRLTGTM